MRVRAARSPAEVKLEGTRKEIRQLAQALRSDRIWRETCDQFDPTPYEVCLERVIVDPQLDDSKAKFSVGWASNSLTIDGGRESRTLLALNLEDAAGDGDLGHSHFDYYPDHPFLQNGSVGVVLVVSDPLADTRSPA